MSPRLKRLLTWVALVALALFCLRLAGGGAEADAPRQAAYGDPGDPASVADTVVEDPERQALAEGAQPIHADELRDVLEHGGVEAIVSEVAGGIFLRTTTPPWYRVEGGWTADSSRARTDAGLPFETLYDVQWDTGALRAARPGGDGVIDTVASLLAPLLLLIGLLVLVVWWLRRRQQGQAGGILQLRKSPARTLEKASHLTFADVGGLHAVKGRLGDVIDELDAVGRRRGTGMQGMAHDEREQTLDQLLVSLDGAEQAEGKAGQLVVMAATNRADILDKALLRPGRFDMRLEVPPPDQEGREAVLEVHLRRLRVDPDG